jgi:hypothetical protein
MKLACQFRQCENELRDRGMIVRFFYEAADPIDDLMFLAVRGARGPPDCEGGWDQLAAAVSSPRRDFGAIVCDRIERYGRRLHVTRVRRALCAAHGVPMLGVDDLPAYLSGDVDVTGRASYRLRVALGDHLYECASRGLAIRAGVSRGG